MASVLSTLIDQDVPLHHHTGVSIKLHVYDVVVCPCAAGLVLPIAQQQTHASLRTRHQTTANKNVAGFHAASFTSHTNQAKLLFGSHS